MVDNKFFWIGGALWLDWVNTQAVSGGEIVEMVSDFGELTAWLHYAEVVTPREVRVLNRWSDAQKATALAEAHALRAHLRRLCEAVSRDDVPDALLKLLNAHLARRASLSQLRRAKGGVELVESLEVSEVANVLFPLARSAAHWLVEAEWPLLKKCANPQCILWFYDTSKNHSRRWCSMEICGNRHKVTAHLGRKKAKTAK